MKIILASKSPRRRELLGVMGLSNFEAVPIQGMERDFPKEEPERRMRLIAEDKAKRAAGENEGALIIAADTLVFLDGIALGKPGDEKDAARMLGLLSGRRHTVMTGLAVAFGGRLESVCEKTQVRFAELSEGEIAAYIATGEPMDKAGAYGIQGRGSVLIEGIDGDYFNVMGLPIRRLYELLGRFGVKILDGGPK